MTKLKRYIAQEIAQDHVDGLMTRREALRRLALLGLGATAASALIAACSSDNPAITGPTTSPATSPNRSAPATTAPVPTEAITFADPAGRTLMGAWAPAASPRGGVLVIHENRGLTEHIRSVAGRFAGSGYSALAIDLLSEEGGTAAAGDNAQAMLGNAPESRLVADMKAGVTEIIERLPGKKVAAVGFCFGGGMVWRLVGSPEPRLAAAVPFYGPTQDNPDFTGAKAAVFGIYGALDGDRVNGGRAPNEAALKKAGLPYQIVTYEGANHAFFNDTGPRYNATRAREAYAAVLDWFGRYVG
jgi:carboxymethylenebutenolidase